MPEPEVTAKTRLLADIDRTWAELTARLGRLSDEQMTALEDHAGWTVKDHIIHLARWERSVVFHLQGKRRSDGLGVDEALLTARKYDTINSTVQSQNRRMPLADALEQMHSTHAEMMALLQSLADKKINAPLRRLIEANTSLHFAEHMPWIETLVSQASRPTQGGPTMPDSVYKFIELVGTSTESWEKAAKLAVDTAAKSLHDLRIAEIEKLDMMIEDDKVVAYRAKVKLSFKYHAEQKDD